MHSLISAQKFNILYFALSKTNFSNTFCRSYATRAERSLEIGSLKSLKPALLLAHKWTEKIDPEGYWLSEKLDGVRALWDNKRRKVVSRLGNAFDVPDRFIKGLPKNMSLDGELWAGHKRFHETVSIVKTLQATIAARKKKSKEAEGHSTTPPWEQLTFQIFDTPSHAAKPFEDRLRIIEEWISKVPTPHPYRLVPHRMCKSRQHLQNELKKIEKAGGEGVMLRAPGSRYVGKRDVSLLKVKNFHDEEAWVLGYEEGKGRNEGVVGSLICLLKSGKLFKIGSGLSDEDRRNPPPIHSIVTFRYKELTRDGIPKFGTFVGVRIDYDHDVEGTENMNTDMITGNVEAHSMKKKRRRTKACGDAQENPIEFDSDSAGEDSVRNEGKGNNSRQKRQKAHKGKGVPVLQEKMVTQTIKTLDIPQHTALHISTKRRMRL